MFFQDTNNSQEKDFKILVLYGLTALIGIVLISRLFYLQVFKYKTYAQRAQYSTSRISILQAPRGIIYDRNGKVFATNRQSISIIAYPNKLKKKEDKIKVYKVLSKIIKNNSNKVKRRFFNLPEDAALPVRIVSDISIEEAIQIVEKQFLLPGISIQEEPIRFYPNKSLAAHVLGYTAQINEYELNKRADRKLGDIVGKSGIEKLFDEIIRGVDGKTIVEVDRFGKPVYPDFDKGIIQLDAIHGKNIQLTLDLELQKATEKALTEAMINGAVVAVDPNTGDVLALASYPNFDPNVFTKPLSNELWADLNIKKAFLNRALLGYVPGSIWKPITLITGLSAMVVKPNEIFHVSGAIYLGSTRFGDWTSKVDDLDCIQALAWSRDTAFYQIGKRLKPEQIRYWGKKLGGGKKTGIEILGEEKGIVPDTKWKKRNYKEDWYPGNTLHYSIGQSFLLVTPLQAARIYSGIATGETVPKLRLIKRINNVEKATDPPDKYSLDPALMKIVHAGLETCVESGTGGASMIELAKVAGKTGSAEVPGSHKTHGWFASYAPVEKPEIVVVVFAEKAGHGGSVAAPVAKKVYEHYFKAKLKEKEIGTIHELPLGKLPPSELSQPLPSSSPLIKTVPAKVIPVMAIHAAQKEEIPKEKKKRRFLFFKKKKIG